MKSRPILFSGPMVRALLDGKKTQTRRTVKPQPDIVMEPGDINKSDYTCLIHGMHFVMPCPYGEIGDLLWVRENFNIFNINPDGTPGLPVFRVAQKIPEGCAILYAEVCHEDYKMRPSIHMPRWVSRLTLEVTEIRIERLQDISERDAVAEGCSGQITDGIIYPSQEYKWLWQSINGEDSWSANPWVWCISFKVHKKNVDEVLNEKP